MPATSKLLLLKSISVLFIKDTSSVTLKRTVIAHETFI